MRKNLFLVCLFTLCANVTFAEKLTASAELPTLKVDISEYSRTNTSEILEPGYTWWRFKKDVLSDTLVVDGIKCIVSLVEPTDHLIRGGWNKNFVQNTEAKAKNARLTGDGVCIDPDVCGTIVLRLEGLPKGKHTIQTYHNGWANPATAYGYPITIKCNGEVVHENINRTFQEPVAANATLLTTPFTIANDGDAVEFSISTSEDNPPTAEVKGSKTSANRTPLLNGFELNTVSIVSQAKVPNPTAGNMHIDGDNGEYLMSWSPANASVQQHKLYIALDSASLESMTEPVAVKNYADTTYLITDLYCLNTYYWRVDEVDDKGTVTPGQIWSFRPRHIAFPGAEGYGRFASGGRGGVVYHVTNLKDDRNPGSLRYGVEKLSGPRTIVFDVGGFIPLNSTLTINQSYITIAGQTAPGKGICLGRASEDVGSAAVGVSGNDCIMRFIRNRVGTGETSDGMGMRSANHSITDHCSVSWSIDEGFSCRESYNLTYQHSIISEALNVAGHDHYDEGSAHGFAAVFGGDISTIHHNLLANNSGRNPRLDGGMEGDGTYKGRVDYFNNVVYNWNSHPAYGEAHEAQFWNNYYKMGPATTRKWILRADVNQRGSNKGTESYYYMGNVLVQSNGGVVFDGTKHGDGKSTNIDGGMWQLVNQMTVDWNPWVDKPFWESYTTNTDATTAYKDVLSDAGCNLPVQDEHDKRQVRTTKNGSYEFIGSSSKLKGLIDKNADTGEREEYPETYRDSNFDTDGDGIPNWWEEFFGQDVNTANNNSDDDHDGYTDLEDYLNYMATPHFETISEPLAINLDEYFYGYNSATYTISGTTTTSLAITGNTLNITPVAGFGGIEYFTIIPTEGNITGLGRRFAVKVGNSSTGIEGICADRLHDATAVFNLNGMRVANSIDGLRKGIYIIQNKKFVVR